MTPGTAAAAAVALATVGCRAVAEPGGADAAAPGTPEDRGPHGVGVTTVQVEDDARDVTLAVEVWYPAEVVPEDPRDRALLAAVETGAVRDARPDPSGAPYPLVVFSHGNQGLRNQSFYLTEHLASHGFVVAAPDHPHNTLFDNDEERVGEVVLARPRDVSATADGVLALSAGAGLLAGLADRERLGVAGHSFGAFTAVAVAGGVIDVAAHRAFCETSDSPACAADLPTGEAFLDLSDARFSAAVSLAPGGAAAFGEAGLASVRAPLMVQAGTADRLTPIDDEARPIFAGAGGDAALVAIAGAGHFSFTDICPLVDLLGGKDGPLAEIRGEGCAPDNLAIERAHAISRGQAAAFLRAHLGGDAGARAWLAGPAPAEAEVERREVAF